MENFANICGLCNKKTEKRLLFLFLFLILNLLDVGPFNKTVEPRKNPKLINAGSSLRPKVKNYKKPY